MITDETAYRRMWGAYPALGELLSQKKLSMQWTGTTSVSITIFSSVDNLLHVYAFVEDHVEEIRELTKLEENDTLRRDLQRLS